MTPSIGKQKISYKDHSNIKFETMDFYLNLAQKIIAKMVTRSSFWYSPYRINGANSIRYTIQLRVEAI